MSKDLEFHYVVSYREGFGWSTAPDTEEALFHDGTIFDWNAEERFDGWFNAYEDSDEPEMSSIAALDTAHYSVLLSALAKMNGEM